VKYTVIYKYKSAIYISTFNRETLLNDLNGENSIFEGFTILEKFPISFQSSYGNEINQGWPENSLLILKEDSILVPKVTKKLVYYTLED
jgi:hypothetical protein